MIERITKFHVKRNERGHWFWHEIGANGEVVGTSGQDFYSQEDAKRACENAKNKAAAALIEVDDPHRAMNEAIRRLAADRATRTGRS